MARFQGLIGIVLILMIAFLFSNNKKRINYRLVLSGLALQLTIGILILKIPAITSFFQILGKGMGNFRVVLENNPREINAEYVYSVGKNDHKIINSALYLKETELKKEVVLITKDINLRIKAKALGIAAEDTKLEKLIIITWKKLHPIRLKVSILKLFVKFLPQGKLMKTVF